MEIKIIAGSVPAGFPSPALDYAEERIDLAKYLQPNPLSTFIIEVKGDSMIGAFIPPEGAVLVVDKSLVDPAKLKSGNIVLAIVNGEFTVKRYVKDKSGVWLKPSNPKLEPLKITEEMEFQIWGVVTYIITDARKV